MIMLKQYGLMDTTALVGTMTESRLIWHLNECTSSLLLIQPEEISINVDCEGNNKKKVRAKFRFGGCHYSFIVTDPGD